MRRILATSIAASLLVAACSGGGSDADTESTTTESPPSTSPPSTEPPSDDDAVENDLAEDVEGPPPVPLSEFAASTDTTPQELQLAEFNLLFGDMPGAPNVVDDGSLWPSGTHSLDALAVRRDDLSAEQQQRLDETIEAHLAIEPIDAFFLEPDGEAVPEAESHRASGFRSLSTPAPAAIRSVVRAFGAEVRAALGGDPLLVYVEIVPNGSLDGAAAKANVLGELSPWRLETHLEAGLDGVANCVVQLTESVVVDGALADTSDARGIVAHELVHCWQGARLGGDVATMNRMADWAKEGMAAFVGEQVGGITRFNAEWWSGYLVTQVRGDATWPLYPSTYAAIGFWTRLAELGDVVESMRATMDAAPDDAAMLQAALSTVSAPEWLAAGTVERPEWGPLWTSNGPGSPGSPRIAFERPLRFTDGLVIESVAPAEQRTIDFTAEAVPDSPGSILAIGLDGFGVARVGSIDLLPAAGVVEFCIEECVCPDGVMPIPPERTLADRDRITASLAGTDAQSSRVTAEITVFDPDVYDCENPDLGEAAASDLVGTWRASPDSVAQVFEQASAFGSDATPFEVLGADGDVIMTFADDGTGTLVYDDVTIFIADEALGDLTIDGSGGFNWGGTSPDILIDGTTFALSVGSTTLGGELLTITDADVPAAGVTTLTATLAGNQLAIVGADGTAGQVFFPVSWTRQS